MSHHDWAMKRVIFLCMVLAGCGGGSGGSDAQNLDFDAFHAGVVAEGVTPISFVPTSGSHNYAGIMELNLPLGAVPQQAYQGQFNISIAFDSANVAATGQASGFTNDAGNTLSGALAFDGGTLVPSADPDRDFLMFVDIGGRLTDDGTPYDLSARVAADLYGAEANGIAGRVFAGAISDGTAVADFDGTFAGQKNP